MEPGDLRGATLPHEDGRQRADGGASPRPYLFLAMECDRPLAPSGRYALHDVDVVSIGRGDRAAARGRDGGARSLALRVPDRWMSGSHAVLSKVLGKWVIEDQGSRNGTLVDGAPIQRRVLVDGDLCQLGHTIFLYRDAVPTLEGEGADCDAAQLHPEAPGLATLVLPFARDLAALARVARSTVSVVVRGESGTGKELIARAVHQISGRSGPFVAMNCGALPETLLESELFGHKKGAFSGATEDRPGLIRAADGGTLFLDEIGDLPAASQAAFLRVLQEREVVPIGATRPIKVDVRLVAATHRDLEQLVDKRDFRADLLARIGGFTITLPPLRDRREDLGLIVSSLLRRLLGDLADRVRLTPEAASALFRCPWPLNVRELEKCLATAVVLAGEAPVDLSHLPEEVRRPRALKHPDEPDTDKQRPLSPDEERQRAELMELLELHGGNVTQVAKALGKARMQIHRWCKRYGIDLARYRVTP